MTLNTGQIIHNRYRIVKLLGAGGFGAVYRAWDTNFNEPVALKESFDTSPAAQKQFQIEARLLFRLVHPNLPRVHDTFVLPGQGIYLVMDFIDGDDVETMLARNGAPLPEAQALEWIGQVCDALSYLHTQNPPVIHRDIKPANIRITPQGRAMLVDFGIAKIYDAGSQTTVGARAVTPGYSPNEQYLSGGRTDARTDVYALGATLFKMLTGQTPPEAPERNLGVTVPLPRMLNPAVSPQVEAAILRAMEMLPEKRFPSVAEFKTALQGAPVIAPSRPARVAATQFAPQSAPQAGPVPQPRAIPQAAMKAPAPQAASAPGRPGVNIALGLASLAASGLGLFFLYQAPTEELFTANCGRLTLSYSMPPWLAALLLVASGVWAGIWLLGGAASGRSVAWLGGLALLSYAAGLFVISQSPAPDLVAAYCSNILLSYSLSLDLLVGGLLLACVAWIAWLVYYWVKRS